MKGATGPGGIQVLVHASFINEKKMKKFSKLYRSGWASRLWLEELQRVQSPFSPAAGLRPAVLFRSLCLCSPDEMSHESF